MSTIVTTLGMVTHHVISIAQVITSICRQPMDTKLSRDCQFRQVFEEALEVSQDKYVGVV